MTKICKQILDVLKKSPEHILLYLDHESMFPNEVEFFDAVRYLESKGLVSFISNQDGVRLGIRATHQAMHPIRTGEHPFVRWLFHEYFGGIAVGVTATLVTEALLALLMALFRILPM